MGNPKVVVTMPNKDLVPDGMCIDADGMLWVAIWGGSCVHRYHPQTGQLLAIIKVPAPHVTSVAFGGSNLQTLLITTAKDGLSDEQLKVYPLSGALFTLETTIKGTLTNKFKMPFKTYQP
jgi:sugar lactone lactonase YvrE